MRSIGGIRLVGILAFAAFAALLATWYVTFTSERERYLTSRNFRILTTIAAQVDSSFSTQERMFRTFLSPAGPDPQGPAAETDERVKEPVWFYGAKGFVPSLASVDESRVPARFPVREPDQPASRFTSESQVVMEGRAVSLRVSVKRRPTDAAAAIASTDDMRDVWLTLGSLLAPIFRPKLSDGALDTLVLATRDGRVLHAVGERSTELTLTQLTALEPVVRRAFGFGSSQQASTPARTFKTVSGTMGIVDLVISGTEYKLFTQPCCQTTTLGSDAASGAAAPQPTAGLVIVGLVNASEFRSKAREIPPTVVMACIALILMALAAWPFLKLQLMGERHRLTRLDVIEVVACGTFAIALLTTVLLDIYAYGQLRDTRDAQLRQFAGELSQHVHGELNAARTQLTCLQVVARKIDARHGLQTATRIFELPVRDAEGRPDPASPHARFGSALRDCAGLNATRPSNGAAAGTAIPEARPKYPLFDTFALIDRTGYQSVKWTSGKWLPDPISVASRTYFTEPLAGRAWHDDAEPDVLEPRQSGCDDTGYVLDSIWSWTTTQPEAVISIPTCDRELPVAAMAIPMRSLINPVLPAGFEFAVISDDGLVVFHSDPQRNTFENLFQETDQNRRLRATVAAHRSETFDLVYAGRSYRAHVDRLNVGAWSVVTLYSNEPAWALHTGWVVLSLAALSGYLLVLAAVLGLCLWARKSEWLWSDPRRVSRYRQLSLVIGALLIAGSLALYFARGDVLILLALALPLAGWLTSYIVLRRPPSDGTMLREAHAEYASLAVLLFLLTSVIPAAGFFTAAHRLHTRTYVKHAQLKLAQALAQRTDNVQRAYEDVPGVKAPVLTDLGAQSYDLYYTFLFGTELRFVDGARKPSISQADLADTPADGFFARVVDDYLPYYSDHSIQMRGLLHDRADDGAWYWNDSTPRLELLVYGPGRQPAVRVASSTPQLLQGLIERGTGEVGIWIVLGGMLLAGLTWAFVRFIETHICLIGVNPPLWSRVKLAGSSGDNLFVVCDPPDRATLAEGAFELHIGRIFNSPTPDQEWVRTLMELDRTEPGRPVLLADFDEHLDDPKLTLRKLAWLEDLASDQTRSVIVLSSASPDLIDHTLRMRVGAATAGDPRLVERWRAVLGLFVVMNWRGLGDESARPAGSPAGPRAWNAVDAWRSLRSTVAATWRRATWARLRTLAARLARWSGLREHDAGAVRKRRSDLAALHAEAEADAFVRAICTSIEGRIGNDSLRLSREQVLDEVTERTETWYRRLWKSCSPLEQLVLAEIADDGFVNHKNRRTVRRLLGRRLVSKDPSFRLMNETFRRFVLSPSCQADVRAFEGTTEPSPWDRLRLPFFVVLIGAALFFMLTQRELFDATIAALTTLTMAVPVLLRFTGLMGGKRDGGEVQKV